MLIADLSDAESIVDTLHNVDRVIVNNEGAIKDGLNTFEGYTESLKSKGEAIDAMVDKADSAFSSIDNAVNKVAGVVPSLADGKADELFEKVKAMHEMADSLKKKSATFMEEGRRTLLDISETANNMSGVATPPRPPRQPPQPPKRR